MFSLLNSSWVMDVREPVGGVGAKLIPFPWPTHRLRGLEFLGNSAVQTRTQPTRSPDKSPHRLNGAGWSLKSTFKVSFEGEELTLRVGRRCVAAVQVRHFSWRQLRGIRGRNRSDLPPPPDWSLQLSPESNTLPPGRWGRGHRLTCKLTC